ncbi:hypothetical protein ABFY55_14580 [Bacillus altitudinis]|uniref:hypothetical protein n=1 Tax=Bacillus altitudinis TaxID=293387 RepID=UPI003D1C70EF
MVNLIIQIISSMGTTIAAIFTAKAAIQAKKSNEIAITQLNKNRRVNIVLPFKKFEANSVQSLYRDWPINLEDYIEENESRFYLEVYNAGNVPAEDVTLHFESDGIFNFSYDYSQNNNGFTGNESHYFHISELEDKVFIHFFRGGKKEFQDEMNFSNVKFLGTILPVEIGKDAIKVHLPKWYIFLVNLKAFNSNLNIINLKLVVQYTDPNDQSKKCSKTILIEPQFFSCSKIDDFEYPDGIYKYEVMGQFISR